MLSKDGEVAFPQEKPWCSLPLNAVSPLLTLNVDSQAMYPVSVFSPNTFLPATVTQKPAAALV